MAARVQLKCVVGAKTWSEIIEINFNGCLPSLTTELEQWNANIAFAQVNLSPLADHKPGNWLFPV